MQYRAARPQTEAWLYGVLATVGMAALACSPVGKDRAAASKDGHAVAAADDRPECPQDSVRSWFGDDRGKVIAIPTAGPTSNVPEYHDCQRLVSGTPPVVGPLVAIFAAEKLDSLFRSSRALASSEFRVAAEILSYDADYGPLHIRKGFNCLRLSPGPGTWRASIQFMGEMEPDCSKSPAAGSTSFDLPVKSYHMPGAAYDDYPAVARWEWDEKGQHHAIGIKCGAGWCEVGTSGKSEQEPNAGEEPPHPGPPTTRTDRVWKIKGWHDAQYIVDGPTKLGDPFQGVWSRVYPDANLDRADIKAFRKGWRESAQVQLSTADSNYKGKLNLNAGLNAIFLCEDGDNNCHGMPSNLGCVPSSDIPSGEGSHTWYAKVVPVTKTSPADTARYYCVVKHQHGGAPIPATTRWRWVNDDETVWIRCTNGCCTVS